MEEQLEQCFFCRSGSVTTRYHGPDQSMEFNCEHCGDYTLSHWIIKYLPSQLQQNSLADQLPVVAAYLHARHARGDKPFRIQQDNYRALFELARQFAQENNG